VARLGTFHHGFYRWPGRLYRRRPGVASQFSALLSARPSQYRISGFLLRPELGPLPQRRPAAMACPCRRPGACHQKQPCLESHCCCSRMFESSCLPAKQAGMQPPLQISAPHIRAVAVATSNSAPAQASVWFRAHTPTRRQRPSCWGGESESRRRKSIISPLGAGRIPILPQPSRMMPRRVEKVKLPVLVASPNPFSYRSWCVFRLFHS